MFFKSFVSKNQTKNGDYIWISMCGDICIIIDAVSISKNPEQTKKSIIDTQNLDEEFEKKLQLKTGKSPEKIKEAVILIKKSLNPSAQVINEDLITLNKTLNEILK